MKIPLSACVIIPNVFASLSCLLVLCIIYVIRVSFLVYPVVYIFPASVRSLRKFLLLMSRFMVLIS